MKCRAVMVALCVALGGACSDDIPSSGPADVGSSDAAGPDANEGDVQDAGSDAEPPSADAGDDVEQPDADDAMRWPGQDMSGLPPLGWEWEMPEAGPEGFTVLVANVGNVDLRRCVNVAYNLCWAEQEAIVAARLRELDADIVFLQEVLAPEQCEGLDRVASDHVCHPDFEADVADQARRLLGLEYSIACDARNGWECIGVKTTVGSIEGCEPGALCRGGARIAPPVEGCDPGFTISAVTAHIGERALDLVNVHPPSGFGDLEQGKVCRKAYLGHVFGDAQTLLEADVALVTGDFNMDPYRALEDEDVIFWNQHVGTVFGDTSEDARPFAYHSGIVEHDPPYWTAPLVRKTLDHAVSNGLIGRCQTLGAAPGLAPLDLAHGGLNERLDHLALWCELDFGR